MKVHTLEVAQWLPRPRDEVFPFFADAFNLERITPPLLRFRVVTPGPIEMRKGTLIDYRFRIHGFSVRWRSEISVWQPPSRFVDEQRHGPYRLWWHEHSFTERDGGTQCRDVVRYAVPGGSLVQRLLVEPDVRKIFDHRRDALARIFSVEKASS
jgi:ligand-binding SRPBCC domain-containing protein